MGSYVISTLLGQIISSGALNGTGVQRIDLSGFPAAPYLIRANAGEFVGATITTR